MARFRLLQGMGAIALLSIASAAFATQDELAARRVAVVHTFTGTPDGIQPMGGLAKGPDGGLYGTTVYGGEYGYDPLSGANGNGTIFRISTNNTYSVLYSFTHLQADFSNTDGRWPDRTLAIAPERMVWRTRTQRALDWHVVLVVDVSGSMEPSVIYSAVMAAILSAIPAVTVKFVAFNTRLLDLSDRVTDPLGLLLEVSVGGGTLIAPALRYARSLLKVPARSIVLVVTDFEEGESVPDVLAETRALVETGCKALGLAALDDAGAGAAEVAAAPPLQAASGTSARVARTIPVRRVM